MIGRLRGILLEKQAPHILLDVNGVGYELNAPMSTFYLLPAVDETAILFTHLAVREDAHVLFGFATSEERKLFRTLIRVNGVGGKLALAILSGMSVDEFARCVLNDDTVGLVRLPGVGKKTAERLIIEMRDRLADWQPKELAGDVSGSLSLTGSGAVSEAVSALVALGYKPQEAERMVKVSGAADMDSEALIRAALKGAMK